MSPHPDAHPRLLVLAIAVALLGPGLVAATGTADPGARAAPGDTIDFPVAIATGPDGAVWLAMGTDVIDLAGIALYSADLVFERAWGLAGPPGGLAVDEAGDVYVEEKDVISGTLLSRFAADGRHQRSWLAPQPEIYGLDEGVGGGIVALSAATNEDTSRRVTAFDSGGTRGADWLATGADRGSDLATGPDGSTYVTFSQGFVGGVARFGANGVFDRSWPLGLLPVAVDADSAGRVFVAGGYDTPGGRLLMVHDPVGGGQWPAGGVALDGAWQADLDVARSGDVYALLELVGSSGARHEVRRYSASGQPLGAIRDFQPVQGLPHPPTATPGPTETATSPPATEPPPDTPMPSPGATRTPTSAATTSPSPAPTAVGRVLFPAAVRISGLGDEAALPAVQVVDRGIDPAEWKVDPYTIVEAAIEADTLRLTVRYGGGCFPHDFGLVASSVFMESYPVQADVLLTHDARGDLCRAIVTRDVAFDLRPLAVAYRAAYPLQAPLLLRLRGWEPLLAYAAGAGDRP